MPLDNHKLTNIQRLADGRIRACCPACAENGATNNHHLLVFPNGSYGCAANQNDPEHTKLIFKLVGQNTGNQDAQPKEYAFEKPELDIEILFQEEDLARLLPDYTYWNGRGVSDETLQLFRGGLATRGKMANRFCFPIFNDKGQIHGLTGRWVLKLHTDLPWKHLGRTTTWVYPLHLNREEIKRYKSVFIVESIGDLLSLWEAGIKNVVVLFGKSISQTLIAALIGLDIRKIYISTNNDVEHRAGQIAAIQIEKKLSPFFDEGMVEIKLPTLKDFGVMTKEQILEWKKDNIC